MTFFRELSCVLQTHPLEGEEPSRVNDVVEFEELHDVFRYGKVLCVDKRADGMDGSLVVFSPTGPIRTQRRISSALVSRAWRSIT